MVALLVFLASCGSSAAQSAGGSATTSAGGGSTSRSGGSTSPGGGPTSPGSTGSSPSTGPPATTTACGPASATTLAANGRVRVYVLHQVVYGCSAARKRSFRLGHGTRSLAESSVGPVAVAGDLTAYGLRNFGVDTVISSVVVRRLTDGAQLKELAATHARGAESFQSIGSVVVRPDGAVAWIGTQHSIAGGRGTVLEVHASSTAGDRVLESGSAIDATSLRLRGTTLTWVDGGVTRHATLR